MGPKNLLECLLGCRVQPNMHPSNYNNSFLIYLLMNEKTKNLVIFCCMSLPIFLLCDFLLHRLEVRFFYMQFLLLNNAETFSIKWLNVNDSCSSTIEEEILLSCGFFSLEALIFILVDYLHHDDSSDFLSCRLFTCSMMTLLH